MFFVVVRCFGVCCWLTSVCLCLVCLLFDVVSCNVLFFVGWLCVFAFACRLLRVVSCV